jgi:mannose-6-phosphate isomerase-like protein (cupin superfamily)
MKSFEWADLADRQGASGRLYYEFLREASLSVGLYVLPAGGIDPQRPHAEDEVYYVVSGRGKITVGDETQAVRPGTSVFVGRGVEHRFHDIEEELQLLVFFAPAESLPT